MIINDIADRYEAEALSRGVTRTQFVSLVPIRSMFGACEPRDIQQPDLTAYRHWRDRAGASSGTIRRELSGLITVLNFGERHKLYPKEDRPYVDLPPKGAPRTQYLSRADLLPFRSLFWSPPGTRLSRACRMVWFATETGARRGAIENLRWDQIDLVQGVIDYRPGRVSKKRRVPVPISTKLMAVLTRMEAERLHPNIPWVLDERGCTLKGFKRVIAGTPYAHIRPHDLRRTFATLRVQAGVSLWQVAGLLGDSMQVVEQHYAHHAPGYLRSAVDAA